MRSPSWRRRQRIVDAKTQWLQFGASRPGIIPAGTDGSTKDLLIYDSVAAIVETEGRHSQVFVGTLVHVGNGWRVIDLPKSEASDGVFVSRVVRQPTLPADAGITETTQKLIDELQRIDKALLAETGDKGKLNAERANTLEQLSKSATTRRRPSDVDQAIRRHGGRSRASGRFPSRNRSPEGDARSVIVRSKIEGSRCHM